MKKLKIPKKAKLITDGGFYKIVDLPKFLPRLSFPLLKKISLATPETNVLDIMAHFDVDFTFQGVKGKHAIYRQVNVTSIVK